MHVRGTHFWGNHSCSVGNVNDETKPWATVPMADLTPQYTQVYFQNLKTKTPVATSQTKCNHKEWVGGDKKFWLNRLELVLKDRDVLINEKY